MPKSPKPSKPIPAEEGSHIGIIPDGNRRWARLHNVGLAKAYSVGFARVMEAVTALPAAGFKEITFYGLSTQNYTKRPCEQVQLVFHIMVNLMLMNIPYLVKERVNVRFYGNTCDLKIDERNNLLEIERSTDASICRLNMNILVNYNIDWDIAGGVLYRTRNIPSCDFVFRSGAVKRLSGFLPIQSAYSELVFCDNLWPDITPTDITQAMARLPTATRGFGA